MSATEDDTELRDLLIQNLENNGVLNKLKAEMRAAVFLAMEEQDKLENKTPLINENLKKCLNTKDGRLVASLIMDFLQVFNLDFTLAVFQPEINSLHGLEGRDLVCRELGLLESELNRKSPLLLELVRRGHHKDEPSVCTQEPSQRQITHARKKYDFYDKERSGLVSKEDVKSVFVDLFPRLNKNMLERFISDELRAADKTFSKAVDLQLFLGMYRRLFSQCRSVVVQDSDVTPPPEEKISSPPVSKIPRYKGQKHRGQSQTAAKDSDCVTSLGRGDFQQQDSRTSTLAVRRERLDLDLEVEDDLDDGDSFFDDPLPKPQKTYGWKVEASGARESPAGSLSEAPRPGGGGGGGSSTSEPSRSRNGASESRDRGSRDSRPPPHKTGSLHLDDVEYDDDFNSHRSDFSRSELSIGEEIEEVSIEGPDTSDKDTTQDLSVSQLSQSHGADYMEEVA
ncbi:FGFR1 oncogene partner isoform X5 [Seriola dumerili]|uniref:Centrosomal protein 43 n=1 Tax=Seriola dumerili TaxID=41447 RepID=A0A3B4UTX4_SERDU|nr:FGFR1 oncogene partner isoform X5 [Seriola dumerili]